MPAPGGPLGRLLDSKPVGTAVTLAILLFLWGILALGTASLRAGLLPRASVVLWMAGIAANLLTSWIPVGVAAIAGVADPERRLYVLVRTHLGTLLEADCNSPMLLNETRSLDVAARAEIAAAFDRYQAPWQATLDELAARGRIASAAAPLRLLLFGMLNWSGRWYRPDGPLTVDQLADSAVALLLGRRSPDPSLA